MKLFSCPHCYSTIYFENVHCLNCHTSLGFDFHSLTFNSPQSESSFCINRTDLGCNWLATGNSQKCFSCSFTVNSPHPSDSENYSKLAPLEKAKRRLFFQLQQLGLPLTGKSVNQETGLQFDFLTYNNEFGAVTGHANGIITILLSEADSVHREEIRTRLSEPYRTLLGHFRHEIAHYYWMLLFKEQQLNEFRQLFGDERKDYKDSLSSYYQYGAPGNWNQNYISPYASSHPWEDWAETWAHYLHIMDTMETAHSHKLSIQHSGKQISSEDAYPYTQKDFKHIFDTAMVLLAAMNTMNRSMGLLDIYPFIVSENVYQKLAFIHSLLIK